MSEKDSSEERQGWGKAILAGVAAGAIVAAVHAPVVFIVEYEDGRYNYPKLAMDKTAETLIDLAGVVDG